MATGLSSGSKRTDKLSVTIQLEDMFANLRADRDAKLAATDFTQLADAPIDSATKLKYREYRTYLRSLPGKFNDSNVHSANVETYQEFYRRTTIY